MFNPWHDLSLGDNAPHEIQALIEIPARSRVKYELDKETGLIRVDRILHSAVYYPANYGLIPQTYCEDNDPLDVFVLSSEPLQSNSIVTIRPIGLINMEDGGEKDDKIVAVLIKDPEWGQKSRQGVMVRWKKYSTLARDGERGRRREVKSSSNEHCKDRFKALWLYFQGCRGAMKSKSDCPQD